MGDALLGFDAPDAERLAVIRECMENYDVGEPGAEWPNNIISLRTTVLESGLITREGESVLHEVASYEFSRCKQLSSEVAELMAGVDVGMGSEASDPFQGFYIAGANRAKVPEKIDETLIRSRFSATIFPPVGITIEPLTESGVWWSEVKDDGAESGEEYLAPWRNMIHWFEDQSDFISTAFVRIGDVESCWNIPKEEWPEGTVITGCVFPRLALGLTRGGSLIGLFGYSVQT